MTIEALADLLHETSGQHDRFEKATPPHNWWDWYAAYMDARQHGHDVDSANRAADHYMAAVKGIVARGDAPSDGDQPNGSPA